MLELRDYPIAELENLLNTTGKQGIDRKLQRYGIDFTSDGRGQARIYTINHIPDPFKVYAIVKLGIPAQADFTKIRNLYYFLFCAEGFAENPLIEMEQIMDAEGVPMARQTITKWINYLQHIDYITFSPVDCHYFVIYKTPYGIKEYKEVNAETYKKGWSIYHEWKWKEGSGNAYSRMYAVSVQEIGQALSYTVPSFTYSIRSPGWQSKRSHSVSSVAQDTICPLRSFWSIDSPIIFSFLILLVL